MIVFEFDLLYYVKFSLVMGAVWALMLLPALLAALSRGHWFWRASVMVGAIIILLPTGAHEPLLELMVYSGVVAGTMAAIRYAVRWRELARTGQSGLPRVTYSLRDLMLATLVVAALTAIAAHTSKELNTYYSLAGDGLDWSDAGQLILTGLGLSALALSAAWLARGRRRLWLRLLVLIGGGALAAWIGDVDSYSSFYFLDFLQDVWVHLGAVSTAIFLLIAMLYLGHVGAKGQPVSWARRLALAIVLLAALAPSGFIYWRLTRPLPEIETDLPQPNGYDALLVAAKKLLNVNIPDESDPNPPAADAYTAFYQRWEAALDEASAALLLPSQVPIDYSDAEMTRSMDSLGAFRSLAQAYDAAAVAAVNEDRIDDAVRHALDTILLGKRISRGGLNIDVIVGFACEGVGTNRLEKMIDLLSIDQIHHAIESLQEIDANREPIQRIIQRDEVWVRHAMGNAADWFNAVDYLAGESYDSAGNMRDAAHRYDANLRLLMTELALRAYRLDHDEAPPSLQRLVPDYLDQVPSDPYSEDGRSLTYRPLESEYLLYSVGPNATDDGGQRMTREQWLDGQGDYFLQFSDELPDGEEG